MGKAENQKQVCPKEDRITSFENHNVEIQKA